MSEPTTKQRELMDAIEAAEADGNEQLAKELQAVLNSTFEQSGNGREAHE